MQESDIYDPYGDSSLLYSPRKAGTNSKAVVSTDDDVRAYIMARRAAGENYSVEHLRRALNIGYKKAKRIYDEMEMLDQQSWDDSELPLEEDYSYDVYPEEEEVLPPAPVEPKPTTRRGRRRRYVDDEELAEEDINDLSVDPGYDLPDLGFGFRPLPTTTTTPTVTTMETSIPAASVPTAEITPEPMETSSSTETLVAPSVQEEEPAMTTSLESIVDEAPVVVTEPPFITTTPATPSPKRAVGRPRGLSASKPKPKPKPKKKKAKKKSKVVEEEAPAAEETQIVKRSKRPVKDRGGFLGNWTQGEEKLASCERIIDKLLQHENAWPFADPVDPVAMGVPDYFDVIKNPMDLGTIQDKLSDAVYSTMDEFLADVELVWSNCAKYNPPDHIICLWSNELAKEFKKLYRALETNELEKHIEPPAPPKPPPRKRGRPKKTPGSTPVAESPAAPVETLTPPPPSNTNGSATPTSSPTPPVKRGPGRPRKKEKLDVDDFEATPEKHEAKWEKRFQELKDFKKMYGHCKVPRMWEENPQLGQWVHTMRQSKRKGLLTLDREDKLDNLGFIWKCRRGERPDGMKGKDDDDDHDGIGDSEDEEVDEAKWEERFAELVDFKNKHGHCKVPRKFDENPHLGWWVCYMRDRMRQGKLDDDKVMRLNNIGFVWNFQEEWNKSFEERIAQLKRFKAKYGHCLVPRNLTVHRQLYQWVHDMRQNRRKGKLSSERIERLSDIGFVWNPGRGGSLTLRRKRPVALRKKFTGLPDAGGLAELASFASDTYMGSDDDLNAAAAAGMRRLADGIFAISGSGRKWGQRVIADETDEDTDTETDYSELEEVAKEEMDSSSTRYLDMRDDSEGEDHFDKIAEEDRKVLTKDDEEEDNTDDAKDTKSQASPMQTDEVATSTTETETVHDNSE